MILISKDQDDANPSYIEVIDWLYYRDEKLKFLSGQNFLESGKNWSLSLDNDGEKFCNNENTEISSIWYRGFINHRIHFNDIFSKFDSTNDNIYELRRRMGQEIGKITEQVFNQYDNTYQLPKFKSLKIDKFSILRKARTFGLNIPNSIITNSKLELRAFLKKSGEVISKPLHESIYFNDDSSVTFFKTAKVTDDLIDSLESDYFFPSLFQEYVEKEVELRVFYLEEQFFTMAIFSQLDPQTKTDFRNYNIERPNRNVPFNIPQEIKLKIINLMKSLDLNTGSLDIIKTPDKKYIFLEVNPTGQFGFTSKPCNYYLEDEIAKTLIINN